MKRTLKKNTLLAACLLGNGDLFKEIRKIGKSNPTVENVIDGVYDEIPSYFAGTVNDRLSRRGLICQNDFLGSIFKV